MALLPYVLDDLLDVPSTRHHFGLGIHPNDLWLAPRAASTGYLRPFRNLLANLERGEGVEKATHIGKDGFQVSLDVQHFAPNEISVKTVDNAIMVEAKHEERPDEHGYISRQFKRRYDLPKGFNAADVVSSLSSDGVLTIKAPPATPAVEGNVRHVQIQQTGPAAINVGNKDNGKKVEKVKK